MVPIATEFFFTNTVVESTASKVQDYCNLSALPGALHDIRIVRIWLEKLLQRDEKRERLEPLTHARKRERENGGDKVKNFSSSDLFFFYSEEVWLGPLSHTRFFLIGFQRYGQ